MKYMVVGGAGFIGSNIVNRLVGLGHEVVVVDNLLTGKKENLNPDAKFILADLNGCSPKSPIYFEQVIKEMDGVDTIFHLAALARVQPSMVDPHSFNDTNVGGTLNLLWMAHKAGVRRLVYSASSSAYGDATILPTPETAPIDPVSPYGLQKVIGEQYCRMFSLVYGLETVSLRYFNVFGENQATEGAYLLVTGIFTQQRLEGKPMTITGDGEQRRDFTYVGDVVSANILSANSDKVGKGEVINIGNGENRSVNELADIVGGPKVYIDAVAEPKETLADNKKAFDLLGWRPTTSIDEWFPLYKKSLGL